MTYTSGTRSLDQIPGLQKTDRYVETLRPYKLFGEWKDVESRRYLYVLDRTFCCYFLANWAYGSTFPMVGIVGMKASTKPTKLILA